MLFHVAETDLCDDGIRFDEKSILGVISKNMEILKFYSLKEIIQIHFG
jgi:hypothetical protein